MALHLDLKLDDASHTARELSAAHDPGEWLERDSRQVLVAARAAVIELVRANLPPGHRALLRLRTALLQVQPLDGRAQPTLSDPVATVDAARASIVTLVINRAVDVLDGYPDCRAIGDFLLSVAADWGPGLY